MYFGIPGMSVRTIWACLQALNAELLATLLKPIRGHIEPATMQLQQQFLTLSTVACHNLATLPVAARS